MSTRLLLLIAAALLSQSCAPSTDYFDSLGEDAKAKIYTNTRRELADQGSGKAAGVTYAVSKVTVGGSYLREKTGVTPGGQSVTPGLHGNPTATQ